MIRALSVAVAIALSVPAAAAPSPDAATLAAARAFMQVSDVQAQMRGMGPRMAESMGQQMRQMFQDNAVPEGLNKELTAAMQAYIGSMDTVFDPAFVDRLAALYAQHFTAEELRHLTALMKDPVMAKMRTEQPAIVAEMMPMIFEVMKPRQQLLQQKIMQIITDWMKQHPADKAKLRSPAAS